MHYFSKKLKRVFVLLALSLVAVCEGFADVSLVLEDRWLSANLRLGMQEYFDGLKKARPGSREAKVQECRRGITLSARWGEWWDKVSPSTIFSSLGSLLDDKYADLGEYKYNELDAKKISMIRSVSIPWRDAMKVLREMKESSILNEDALNLTDSLALIFLRVKSPSFWDYRPFSEEKGEDEVFFYNCMEDAISCYMKEVNGYEGSDPIGECEKKYCGDLRGGLFSSKLKLE